ncbi:MAG: S8 family serine peptidase [Anaerolineaceae bacterium]|nr:S8 family serine peptidase [Anaerolineaceae bacterium]
MSRHFAKFLLIGLLFLLAIIPAGKAQAANEVVVRIPVDEGTKLNRSAIQAERMIDYGSFLWAVMDGQDLAALEKSGAQYQTIDNPYTLTLGGQSFDPLFNTPDFSTALSSKEKSGGAGLHLVQFHGPIKDAWLADLEAAGLEIVQYIHPFTYVVWGETIAMDRSRAQEAVRWAGDFLPAYAVLPQNRALNNDPILARALILPQAGTEKTIAEIEALGGKLVSSAGGIDPTFDLATFLLPGNLLNSVATLTGVYTISPVPLDGGDRGEMSNQINVGNVDGSNLAYTGYEDWLDSVGLSGDGVVIANVDSGVDQNHPDLVNRILSCSGSSCSGSITVDHGTHTAGIMAGDGSSGVMDAFGFLRGLGMAPGANLVVQYYYPTYTYVDGMLTLMAESYNNGAVVSGNSWGPSGTPQGYDENTRLVDVGVRDADPGAEGNQPLSYVLSIMNGYGGTSTQGSPDEAKNTFTVGSTVMQYSDGTQYTNVNDLSANTAHGPALDGRTIPHMVAPGCYVDSTGLSNGYVLKCGTSMASPQVTGSVALFIEYYRQLFTVDPSPALVKAAFLPVAHDLAGNLDADGFVMGHPFDSKQGWGRLNTDAVLNPTPNITTIYIDQETLFTETGQTWTYPLSDLGNLYNLRAMLVWTDAPGAGLGDETDAWVNDLDFALSVGSDTYYGNSFGVNGLSTTGGSLDGMNNTEGIFLNSQSTSSITFTVSAANIAGDGVPNNGDVTDQDFALVIYITRLGAAYHFPIFYQ